MHASGMKRCGNVRLVHIKIALEQKIYQPLVPHKTLRISDITIVLSPLSPQRKHFTTGGGRGIVHVISILEVI